MSFGTYARRVRDTDLPYATRYSSLRCAVSRYCPIGFHATLSFLSTAGNLKRDEEALLRALNVLETSRAAWLADIEAFAARRRAEKREHRRTPSAADRRLFYGYRWAGPDGHAAVLHTVRPLWTAHVAEPFPETPSETTAALAYLDSAIEDYVSAYLSNGGELDRGHWRLLVACLDATRAQLPSLGYPTGYHTAYCYFRRLHKLAALVVGDV